MNNAFFLFILVYLSSFSCQLAAFDSSRFQESFFDEEEFDEGDFNEEFEIADSEDPSFFLADSSYQNRENEASSISHKNWCSSCRWLTEIKAGYFFFTSEKLRKVYHNGGADLQLSSSYAFWKPLQVYGSLEFLWRSGRSLNGNQKTRFFAVPLSLGLRAAFNVYNRLDYYLTLGPRYYFVHVHNASHYVGKNHSENGLGGFLNTGCLIHFSSHFVFDIFGEYSYKKMHFHSSKPHVKGHAVQIGGFTFGGGLGYVF